MVLVENLRNGLCHNELCLLGTMHNLLPRAWICEVDSVGGLLLVESIICENLSLVFDFLRIRGPRQFGFPNELVRSVHRFGFGCCGLRLEPREFALDHLGKTDDVDMLLEL